MDTKDNLRIWAKDVRKTLDIEAISLNIIKKLFELPEYIASKTVLAYYSLPKEVDTSMILVDSSKKILLPRVAGELIEVCRYYPNKLQTSKYGICEPITPAYQLLFEIDMVILPGLIFTTQGDRLGYGKGYYDRFLNNNLNAIKIGLVPDILLLEHIPTDEHDQKCDIIITETRVINTKNI